MSINNVTPPGNAMSGLVASAVEYMMDAGQRSVLFMDVLRRRGDQYREHIAQTAPHVLQYAAELIVDGRKLDEPVNYALVRIIPPQNVEIDDGRRPFIVVDPRAGHGPGIGGFKADSEIGVAMKAGHSCSSSDSCRSLCPDKRSRVSRALKPGSSRRSSAVIRKPTAIRV